MSATPFLAAFATSKGGITLAPPPRKLICTRPLPSALTFSTNFSKFAEKKLPDGQALIALRVISCALAWAATARRPARQAPLMRVRRFMLCLLVGFGKG